jgi:hypothetical protein
LHVMDVDDIVNDYKGNDPEWRKLKEDEVNLASQY